MNKIKQDVSGTADRERVLPMKDKFHEIVATVRKIEKENSIAQKYR